MPVGLATGRLPRPFGSDRILADARALDVRDVFLSAPVTQPVRWRTELRAGGVNVCAVAPDGAVGASDEDAARFHAACGAATVCASGLKAGAVVVEGGGLGGALDAKLREVETRLAADASGDAPSWEADRAAARERAAERAVRALHAGSRGVPLAIRPGGGPADLLGFEETAWMLSELPALGLWLDPACAERSHRLGCGPPLEVWVDAYAGRCGGVFVQGLYSNLRVGAHPAEGGLDWTALAEALPRSAPWVLDLAPDVPQEALADAVRLVRSVLG